MTSPSYGGVSTTLYALPNTRSEYFGELVDVHGRS